MTNTDAKNMTDMQKVADALSGYNGLTFGAGARDDFYYDECPTPASRLEQIERYAESIGICLLDEDIFQVDTYLQADFDGQNAIYYAFAELA